jgi:hypothetical protein
MFVGLCSYACELSALCNAIFEDFPKQLMLQIHVVAISGRFTANAKEKSCTNCRRGLLAQCSSSIVSRFSNLSTGTGALPNLVLVAPR